MIGAEQESEVRKLKQEVLRQQFEAEAKNELKQAAFVTRTGPLKNLKPWRQVTTPHPDIASGSEPEGIGTIGIIGVPTALFGSGDSGLA